MQKKFVSAGSESGFETRAMAKQHCSTLPVTCPACSSVLKMESSRVSSGDRWMKMGACKRHGNHLVRYRVRHKNDGEFAWTRTVYAPDEELERYYRDKLARSGERKRRGGRRHSGRGKGGGQQKPKATGEAKE